MFPSKLVPALLLLAAAGAWAQHKAPTESQCRNMVESMVQMMKAPPMPERDRPGAKALIDRAEKMIKDHRSRGIAECETWAALSKMVTTQ